MRERSLSYRFTVRLAQTVKHLVLVAGLLGSSLPQIAGGQTARVAMSVGPAEGDRAVLAAIVMNAVSALKLCGLALDKTSSADVRYFCRRTAGDNSRIALSGMQLAQRLGAIEVKLQPLPDTAAVAATLATYPGSEFDREFLLDRIDSDETSWRTIRYAVEVAADGSVKRYESGVLRLVQNDLDFAETALRRVSEAEQ